MNRWIAGNVMWPATERLCGRDTLARTRRLLTHDRADAEQLRALQSQKLRNLLAHAERHCPYYAATFRSSGLDVRDPALSIEALRRLPTLTRSDITEHLDAMTTPAGPGGAPIPHTTGGSTGEPLRFYIDRCRQSADWAARFRARRWWGVRPGDPEVILWGAPINTGGAERLRQWRDRLLNQYLFSAFDLTDKTMRRYCSRIREIEPACVYGYASSLGVLARFAMDQNIELRSPHLKGVFVTGEVLLDADCEAIETAFGAPVIVEYGSRDGGLTACQCPSGLLHVPMENLIVELLDEAGEPVADGEPGEVTITYLELFAMPLIRYRIGDLATRPASVGAPCHCGRSSDRLDKIQGRVTDHLVTKEGDTTRRMHALSVIYVLREIEGVKQFRVTQTTLERLEVDLVTDARFVAQSRERIIQGLQNRMGAQVEVLLRERDRIPPTASGKHACVVSALGIEGQRGKGAE